MIAVWESDITATFLIFRLNAQQMQHLSLFWASYSITWPRCNRSFVSNNWCLVWTGSAFPQSFLSCKQSDTGRKDCRYSGARSIIVLYIITAFCFFRQRDSLSQSRVERRWFEIVSKGYLVITLAARFCKFWSLSLE